jgi:DNA-binding transcriptional LysR family regulator
LPHFREHSRRPRLETVQLHREDYVLVGSPALLTRHPLRKPEHAISHTLIDENPQLPLFSYLRDAPHVEPLPFGRILYRGTIAAMRHAVLACEGVAVLPRYLVEGDIRKRRLRVLLRRTSPLHDHFRLFFRAGDPRRGLYETLATLLKKVPLR